MPLWVRTLFFTLLVPGTVAGYIPYSMTRYRSPDMNIGWLHWFGLPIMCLGIIFYGWTALSFLLKGKGTPSIWLAKAIGFIIGNEPMKMVSSGLYRYSRNPMYLGVMTTVAGEGLFFRQSVLLWYVLSLFVLFNLVVLFIEEPHLEEKFGEQYRNYKKTTRRWL